MGTSWSHFMEPDVTPFVFKESKFDPMFGFEETGRKKRVPPATEEELSSANIRDWNRDFCARTLMEYKGCMYHHFPFYRNCDHLFHAYGWCQYDDYVIRMKEYERERRLMERAKRVGPENAGYKVAPPS